MAYDLIVRGAASLPAERVRAAFAQQPWFEIDGDARGMLLTNTNTGVYATLAPAERAAGQLRYEIKYNRPEFFVEEGLLTLAFLAQHLGWSDVYDPQRERGVSFDAAERAAIVAAWREANERLASPGEDRPKIDRQRATAVWRWNYDRPALQARLGEGGAQVPRIFFTAGRGAPRAQTATMWRAGAHALLLPPADAVLYREEEGAPLRVLDRGEVLRRAAYYVREIENVPAIEAPRFSVLLSAIASAQRGAFTGEIMPSDSLDDRP